MTKYKIRTAVFRGGERFPVLLDSGGMPLFKPTLFAISELRNSGCAAKTIENSLGALMVFIRFLDENNIDLEARTKESKLLELGEIEGLARSCRATLSRSSRQGATVTSDVCASRIRTITNYLAWLSNGKILREGYVRSAEYKVLTDIVLKTIRSRVPPKAPSKEEREGLSREDVMVAERFFLPNSADNIWTLEYIRFRNYIVWSLLYHLGIRGSELLGLRIGNIDLRRGVIKITRQPDAQDDPRRNQPNTKTRGRNLEINELFQRLLTDYILRYRRTLKDAFRHDFLICSRNGDPLSKAGLYKIFTDLRRKNSAVSRSLTAHVMRHTWNDSFSDQIDGKGLSEAWETKMRSYLMGWNPTSDSAKDYTKRTIRRKAQEVSLQMQGQLMNKDHE
jgi:integrase